jgi:esterase/lipase
VLQVLDEVKKLDSEGKQVTRISVTGYSLGGLIGRYLVGVLYQRKFFDTVTPVNFTTVATPHIGLVVYSTFRSKLFLTLGTRLLSRTGEQFYAQDKWSPSGRPLVEVMADPSK